MSPQARIDSIPVLRQFRASLITFASVASIALEEAGSEIQRMLLWLKEDQYRYWKGQVQTRSQRYIQAKLALKQREVLDRALAGSRSSCVDEKKAVQVAERRLREAEHKLRMVRTWSRQIERQVLDYRGASQRLVQATDTEIPNACARLEKMVESLEKYVAVAPPEMPWSPGEKPESDVLSRASEGGDRSPALLRMRELANAFRSAVPSAEIRRQTPIEASGGQWLANLQFSEALVTAAGAEKVEVRPTDKVLRLRLQGEPRTVYLTRTSGDSGDSGWTLGADGVEGPADYAAILVSDLLSERPEMAGILSLPPGYLVQVNLAEGLEALFDPDDNMIWWNGRQKSPEMDVQRPEPEGPIE